MARTMMLTGMDDLAVRRVRHWAESCGMTPSEYLTRLSELHERLNSLASAPREQADSQLAGRLLADFGLVTDAPRLSS